MAQQRRNLSNEEPPCAEESKSWRECLKQNDYTPDRVLSKCDSTRHPYYKCINAWRATQPPPPNGAKVGAIPPLCSGMADRLRLCMEMNMFEVGKCQREMGDLRGCVAQVDPEVAAVTREMHADVVKAQREKDAAMGYVEPVSSIAQAWPKLWGPGREH